MRIEVARIAAGLLLQRRGEFMRDVSLPLSVRGMINVHLETAWIPGFWSVAIRATKPNFGRYLTATGKLRRGLVKSNKTAAKTGR